jgi:putative DNA primase/helicase
VSAYERLVDALRDAGKYVNDKKALCPAHDDSHASLSVGDRRDGKGIVIKCHAGCEYQEVLAALDMSPRDLFDDEPMRAVYNPKRDYHYPGGRRVHRKPNKDFPQSGNNNDTSLFHADRIGDATTVYVPEGEKDVEAIEMVGGTAVCPPMGAGQKDLGRYDWNVLHGKTVIIIADKDDAGRSHAHRVAYLLDGIAASVRIVEAAVGKDAADHIAAGHSLDELVELEPESSVDGEDQDLLLEVDHRPLFPPPGAPLDVARKMYAQYRIGGNGLRTLVAWRGGWMIWRTTHWSELDTAHLRSDVYDMLGEVDYKHPIREKGVIVDYEIRPWSPDKRKVANVLEAMEAIGHLSTDIDPPSWIDLHSAAETAAGQVISCTNGLLDLSTRTVHDHTPALFNVVSVPFDYQADVPDPVAWLEFLASVWPDDPDSIALLQEYIGYVLSGRTDMQKLLLLIGPTRSGKGTIARMLTELVSRGHVAGPTLASLGTNFGLSPLLGKPLAIISDARLGSTPTHTVVERLLSITGEDMLTVDRKFRDPWSGKLPTRFLVLSNELPRFKDSSGAIANRLLILQMTNSFLGREDRTLDDRLRAELPGILVWALAGLDRLIETGKFTVPGSSRDAANLMMDLASPVSAFVRERCVRGVDESVSADDLYAAWKLWAEDNGHHAGAKSTFGRDLRAVVPELKLTQPRAADGSRERRYSRIGLQVSSSTFNGVYPVPPVPDAPAGRGTGYNPEPAPANPQVNHGGTGGTGESAFKVQHSDSARLFDPDPVPTNGERRYCKCGNELLTPEARTSGKCKSCRDKLMAGYDS